jgi:hypothetical protein
VSDDFLLADECFSSVDRCFPTFGEGVSAEDFLVILVGDDILLVDDCSPSVDDCFSILGDGVSAEDRLSCLDDGLYPWEYIPLSDSLFVSVGDVLLLVEDCFSSVDDFFFNVGDGALVGDCLSAGMGDALDSIGFISFNGIFTFVDVIIFCGGILQ